MKGPKVGYNSTAKNTYRVQSIAALAKSVADPSTATVCFFPGEHGYDIPVFLKYGFSAKNLIAIEERPELVMGFTREGVKHGLFWRERYPEIPFYNSKASRVLEKIAASGRHVDAAHLDFCGNFGNPLLNEMSAIAKSGALLPGTVFAVTIAKGREFPESSAVLATLRDICPVDIEDVRLFGALKPVFADSLIEVISQGSYVNHKNPMAWIVARRRPRVSRASFKQRSPGSWTVVLSLPRTEGKRTRKCFTVRGRLYDAHLFAEQMLHKFHPVESKPVIVKRRKRGSGSISLRTEKNKTGTNYRFVVSATGSDGRRKVRYANDIVSAEKALADLRHLPDRSIPPHVETELNSRLAFSVDHAARIAAVTTPAIRLSIKLGILKALQVGKRTFVIPSPELRRFIGLRTAA